jgi:aminobenzoyl-glutamate utilization protein B
MNVGVNYLREHMIPDARIHYVITKGGGAPNVVPDLAASFYYVRTPAIDEGRELFERVKNVAKGAALMTGTEVDIDFHSASSNLVLNDTINDVLRAKMEQIGAPQYSESETQFAHEIAGTFPPGSDSGMIRNMRAMYGSDAPHVLEMLKGTLLSTKVLPKATAVAVMAGSTDVGDVSWVTSTGQFWAVCSALGTPGHSWQLAAQAGMSIGQKGMIFAGQVLAESAALFMQNAELLGKAQAEFAARTKENPYVSPIPDGAKAPIGRDDD